MTMNVSINFPDQEYRHRITYIAQFLNEHPLKPVACQLSCNNPGAEIQINYYPYNGEKANWTILRQNLIFNKTIVSTNQLHANIYRFDHEILYSVESHGSTGDRSFLVDRVFQFDLIETLFFHLSRYEEFHCTPSQWDQWDMMKASEQFLVRNSLQRIPVVDQLVRAFFKALELEPLERPTSYSMTHDIDVLFKFQNPYRFARASLRSVLDKRGWQWHRRVLKSYYQTITKQSKDPYDNFDWMLTEHANFEKIIYFMTGGITRHDNFYKIRSSAAQKYLEMAQRRGYWIGLHPSYATPANSRLFTREKKRLEKASNGPIHHSRQHFLHFDFTETPKILDQNDIQVDATMGYQDLIGFRCGTGFRYRFYNLASDKPTNFHELPMVVMDGALLDESGQDLDRSKILLQTFLDNNAKNTHITFNFHNTIFDHTKRDADTLKKLYLDLTDLMAKHNPTQ